MTTKTVLTSLFATFLVTAVGCGSSGTSTTGGGGATAGSDGGAGTGTAGTGADAAAGSGADAAAGAGVDAAAGTGPGTAGMGADAAAGTGADAAAGTGADAAAGTTADAAADTMADATPTDTAGACNALTVGGAEIAKVTHAGPAPTMTGGTIVAGTYVLTNIDKYNGTQGSNMKRETYIFTAGHVEIASEDSADGKGVVHYSAGFAASTNTITLSVTCPAVLTAVSQYTATATTVATMSEPTSTDQEIHTYTKQ